MGRDFKGKQFRLFDEPPDPHDDEPADYNGYPDHPGYSRGSATSKAAAEQIEKEGWLGPLKKQIMSLFTLEHPTWTCDEIELALPDARGLPARHQTISPRLTELCREKFLRKVKDFQRMSTTGKYINVYERYYELDPQAAK